MTTIPVRTTYLEMRQRPECRVAAPADGLQVQRAVRPSVEFYRGLYDAVGREFRWVDRTMMTDEQLAEIIDDDRVEIYVLYVEGVPAGYAELDRRRQGEIELAYFGIVSRFRGHRLGPRLLDWAVDKAWSYAPDRFWVHTCEWDHPAALPMYLAAGFHVFDVGVVQQALPQSSAPGANDPR